ncbi:MAG: PIN domain-containing protein [Acidobacteria bacterium]|nr:PIN domain-containing protein [Acidobacteriota bacterium]
MGQVSSELGQRIYFDTNVVIYAVEGFADYADQIQALLKAMSIGEIVAVTSELTLAETLVKPLKDQNVAIQRAYRRFLIPTAAFEIKPISRNILETAAQWRATSKLKLPDAIHLATCLSERCDSLLTNDDAFKSLNLTQIKMLSDVSLA